MRGALLLALVLLAGCAARDAPHDATPATPTGADASSLPSGTWRAHAPDPAPRYEVGLARVGDDVYEIAGLTASLVPSNVVEVYHAAADQWAPAPPLPVPAHHVMAASVDADGREGNGTIYVFGGWIGLTPRGSDRAFRLDAGAPAWVPIAMPHGRGAGAVAVVDGRIWLLGGTDAAGGETASVDVFDPRNGTWSEGPKLPHARDHLAAAVLDGRLYVVGGRENSYETTTGEGYVLREGAWQPMAPAATPRAGFGLVAWRGHLVALGGELRDGLIAKVESYDPAADRWSALPDMPHARTGLGAWVWRDRLFVMSGANPTGQPLSDAPESLGA